MIDGGGAEALSMRRYTVRVSDVGFLTFDQYDELEREELHHRWRLKNMWRRGEADGIRFDGVMAIARPELPDRIRRRLLASARAQLEWAKEE